MATKASIKLPVLLLLLCPNLILTGRVTAQTFMTLHSFSSTNDNGYGVNTNSDGANPQAGLILSGNTLFGTAPYGGNFGNGTLFSLHSDGTGFTNLYSFAAGSGSFPNFKNSNGAIPIGGLTLSNNTLYATASQGGTNGAGTVFAMNLDSIALTNLYQFAVASSPAYMNADGAFPLAGLILASNALYGTAVRGGSGGYGTLFKVNTDGTGFTNLYSFEAAFSSKYTNGTGAAPYAPLIMSGSTLYGTTKFGGTSGVGTVFAINSDGSCFRNMHTFVSSDGAYPNGGLILSGSILYGTTSRGGGQGSGTVFAVNIDGTGFTNLHTFTLIPDPYEPFNSDGANPNGSLIISGTTLYGTASAGGNSGNGTVFALNIDGTAFATMYYFTATPVFPRPATNSDGATPYGSLLLSGNTLHGTTQKGGDSGNGTIFSLLIPPQLTIIPSGQSVILTWPTNYDAFTLQSTTNLGSSAIWTTNLPAPVVVNGQNTVTNAISRTQQFYRLRQY